MGGGTGDGPWIFHIVLRQCSFLRAKLTFCAAIVLKLFVSWDFSKESPCFLFVRQYQPFASKNVVFFLGGGGSRVLHIFPGLCSYLTCQSRERFDLCRAQAGAALVISGSAWSGGGGEGRGAQEKVSYLCSLKVVTNEKGEAVGDVLTIIC
jgi:hypothetical protein